jgi:hypothetical protein
MDTFSWATKSPPRPVTPVDYKHGRPKDKNDALDLWPTDRVQLSVQAMILRENGYRCEEGVVYYTTTKQRVRVEFTDAVIRTGHRRSLAHCTRGHHSQPIGGFA